MIGSIIIGGLAGFLASRMINGESYGLLVNIIVGILGGVVGKLLFGFLGLGPTGLIGNIIAATIGAVILITVFAQEKRARTRRHGCSGQDD